MNIPQGKRIKLLLIEDDLIDQRAFTRFIQADKHPYDYVIADSIEKAKKILGAERFDIVISDYQLPDGVSMEILGLGMETPIVITTGTGSEEIAVQAMKAGAYDYLIKDPDRYYLKILPVTIEKIMHRKESEKKIRMLSSAITGTHDSVFIIDAEGRVIFVNQAFCKTYGYEEGQVLGRQSGELWDAASLGLAPNRSEGEFIHKKRDGSQFPVLLSNSILKQEGDREIATVYIARDMTEHKQAEQALLQRTEELARSKTELEQLELFAFVASHDLQEPLHKIVAFGGLLKDHMGSKLDAEAQDYLQQMEIYAKRMSEKIIRTRDFSMVAKGGHQFETVNLKDTLRQIITDLDLRLKEARGTIELKGDFPAVMGDRIQLQQLFQNLIANAIKFRKTAEPLRIAISTEGQDHEFAKIAVEDNGIGFDEKYSELIFKPFKRLHTLKEYEGSGMGLSICQKIVVRHGGKISVRSTPGKGSTFIVSLPLRQSRGN